MVILMKEIDKKLKLILRGIIVFLIFWYSSYFQLIPVKLLHLDTKHLSNVTRVVLSSFSSLCILVIFLIIYRKELKEEFKLFKKNINENLDVGVKYWMIGLGLMMVTNFILNFVIKAGGANNEHAVQDMIKALPWLMLIDAGFIAPINEEIVFRKTVNDVFKNKWILMILSFILFGGAHVVSGATVWTDYLYIIPYGILGASFAMCYYKTKTVFTSISMHMLHNTILILLSIFTAFMA